MDILNDPEMKEVVLEFCQESNTLLSELEDILDNMEEKPKDSANFEKFGQIIDRIMGAAATLNAQEISKFAELGKIIGYKSSQVEDVQLRNVVTAILFDAVDLLKMMINKIETGNPKSLENLNTEAFGTRLKWLSEKFKGIDRASVGFVDEKSNEEDDDDDIDGLMKSLGF